MDNLGYTMIKIAWLEIVPKLFKMILVISAENPEAYLGAKSWIPLELANF